MKHIEGIRIEKVGDINSDYPYLEAFLDGDLAPFLEVGISQDKTLLFKLYPLKREVFIKLNEWEYILSVAKDFLTQALKDEDDFLRLSDGK